MYLCECTLEELESQRTDLISGSDDEWKQTIYYQERLTEIDRCINNLKNEEK
jgi:hypothetical protein